jgi:O-antigen/teichoic acid export membrane protein
MKFYIESAHAGFLVGLGKITQLVLLFFLGNHLGGIEFGVFVTLLTLSQLLSTFSSFGISPAGQKIIPQAMYAGNYSEVANILICIALAFFIFVTFVIFLGVISFDSLFDEAENLDLSHIIIFVSVYGFSVAREMLARSFSYVFITFFPRDILWSMVLIVFVLFSSPTIKELIIFGTYSLLIIEIATFLIIISKYFFLFNYVDKSFKFSFLHNLSQGKPFMTSALGGQGFERVDILFVATFLSMESAGIYGLCAKLAPIFSISQRFITPILLPRLSSSLMLGPKKTISLLRAAISVNLFLCIFLTLMFYLFGSELLARTENEIDLDVVVLIILCVAHFFNAIGSNFGALILVSEKPSIHGRVVISLLAFVVLLMYFVQPSNIVAVALLTSFGIVSYNFIFSIIAIRIIKKLKSVTPM